jgi:hypothetical protein
MNVAKYSNQDKITKMTTILRGLQHPAVQLWLVPCGFDQGDFDEGWSLLDAAMGRAFAQVKPYAPSNQLNEVIPEIDRWENRNFDIADASLKRRFPRVHADLFLNLTKMNGHEVLISVPTFVSRYEALSARADDEAKAAVALLHKRGITPDSVAGVKALLDRARKIQTATAPTPDPEREALLEKAVGDMWAWYLEWAQVARTAIPNKRLRIHLGISTASPARPEDPGLPAAE